MRILILTLVLAGVFCGDGALYALSLSEACRLSIEHTEIQQLSKSINRTSDFQIQQAKLAFLPKVITTLGTRQNLQQLVPGQDANSSFLTLTAHQPLYPISKIESNLSALEAVASQNRWTQIQVALSVSETVITTYCQALAALTQLQTTQDLLSTLKKRAKEIESRAKIGRSKASDVLAVNLQVDQLQTQLVSLQQTLNTNLIQLSYWVGSSVSQSQLEPIEAPLPLPQETLSLSHRADIQALEAAVAAAKFQVEVLKNATTPELGLDLTGQYQKNSIIDKVNGQASITATFPLLDYGAADYAIKVGQETAIQAELALSSQKRLAQSEVDTALTVVQNLIQQNTLLTHQFKQAKRYLKMVQLDYDHQIATLLDVTDATTQWLNAKNALDLGRINLQKAWAVLQLKQGYLL